MPVKLLRRVLALLIVTAYVGTTMLQSMTTAEAASAAAMSGMMQDQDSPGGPMPCKGMVPHCVTDLGCIFLVSLPATPDLAFYTATEWSSVTYAGTPQILRGRSIKPALGPPITFV